jgi:four helix bundle protein
MQSMQRRENIILAKTDAYSNRIVRLYQYLTDVKHEHIMSKQILRSGTSIGANTMESRNAQGSKDFINKLSIALKEADETEYWLQKLNVGGCITDIQYDSMHKDNEEIVCILTKIIKTMKQKLYGQV